jgi:hypothetical protein
MVPYLRRSTRLRMDAGSRRLLRRDRCVLLSFITSWDFNVGGNVL